MNSDQLEHPNCDHFPQTDTSIWLRSCNKEVKEPVDGLVTYGKIPTWLSGSLIRNGPGGVDVYGEGACKHLFDGPGLLQKFQLRNGAASYTSKFIQSNAFTKNSTAHRLVRNEFGTVATPDPCETIFQRISAFFSGPLESTMSDNANISIHPFGDEIYSISEFSFAHRIDLESLDTLDTINVHNELGIISHSAHPHILGSKIYNIGQKLSLWQRPHYIIAEMDMERNKSRHRRRPSSSPSVNPSNRSRSPSVITNASTTSSLASSTTNLGSLLQEPEEEAEGDRSQPHPQSPWASAKILASIPSRWPLSLCYMHSFSVTQNYFVLIEQPLGVFLPSVPVNQISGRKPIASCLKFYPEEDTLFHVISRHGKRRRVGMVGKGRRTYRAPAFFFLHTINAFEMKDAESRDVFLVVDVCCYNDPGMIDCMYVEALRTANQNPNYANMFRGRPKRFLMKLSEGGNNSAGPGKHPLQPSNWPEVESEMIVDIGCETPRINDSYNGKPYNYFYAISSDVDKENPGTLIKVDVLRKTYETWCESGTYPSEPIFVPRPGSQREDDGLVLSSLVYGGESPKGPNRTSLLIMNATTWDPLARVEFNMDSVIPKCLHGWFFPDRSFSASANNLNINAKAQEKDRKISSSQFQSLGSQGQWKSHI